MTEGITILPLTKADEPFLWEMLYQAICVPEGSEPPPRDIVYSRELARYVHGWGQPGDMGFVAINKANQPIGAAWLRLLTGDDKGYGYVDPTTPELSIAVLPEYRGKGVGTLLLRTLLNAAKTRFTRVSLSVSADNPAVNLYQRFGFQVAERNSTSLTMLWEASREKQDEPEGGEA